HGRTRASPPRGLGYALLLPIQTTGFSAGSPAVELTGGEICQYWLRLSSPSRAMYAATSAGAIRIAPSTRMQGSWRVVQSLYTVAVETPSCLATSRTAIKPCSTDAANGCKTVLQKILN